ncbi:MAG: 4Fe-4S binding protein [Nitrososphaerales archaeon]|nr:4Fe-4S binding protein [Nitrososphaerales archaeon]
MFACSRRLGFAGLDKAALYAKSVGGFERGFTVIVCRACIDAPCLRACPVDALRARTGGGVLLDPSKCIGCRFCEKACDIRAIFWDDSTNKPVICVHCGYCVNYCNFRVLGIEETGK